MVQAYCKMILTITQFRVSLQVSRLKVKQKGFGSKDFAVEELQMMSVFPLVRIIIVAALLLCTRSFSSSLIISSSVCDILTILIVLVADKEFKNQWIIISYLYSKW